MVIREKTENEYSLRDFFFVLFRYKVSIIALMLSTTLTVIAGVYTLTPIYEATSKILVKQGRQNANVSSLPSTQESFQSGGLRTEYTHSEIELLENRYIIEKTIEKLGIDFLFPPETVPETFLKKIIYHVKSGVSNVKESIYDFLSRIGLKNKLSDYETAVVGIQRGLSASIIKNTDVIEVRFKWFSPDIATSVLDTLIHLYVEHHLNAHKTQSGYDFIQKQVEIIGKRLSQKEDELALLKDKTGISSYGEQVRNALGELTKFNTALKDTTTKIAETETRKNELDKRLSSQEEAVELTKEVNRNPLTDQLKMKLLNLEIEKEKLELKYKSGSQMIAAVDEEIEKVKTRFEEEQENVVGVVRTGRNKIYEDTQTALLFEEVESISLKEANKEILRHIQTLQDELDGLDKYNVEMMRLQRQIDLEERNYKLYHKQLEVERISGVLDAEKIVNVRVIDPAGASSIPVKPKKMRIIALGMVLSIFVGIGMAFVSNYLDHSIKNEDNAGRYLHLPVLASIRETIPTGEKKIEAIDYEKLKNIILSMNSNKKIKTILLTSAIHGEGCSTVASHLADSLAKNKALNICLVDCSSNHPVSQNYIELTNNPDSKELIISKIPPGTVLNKTIIPNLSVITNRKDNGNPIQGLESQNFNMLMELENNYDYLIFDYSPVTIVPDVTFLASLVDAVILVVRANKTRREVIQKTKKQMEMANANILGLVLNRTRHYIPGFIYNRLL